MSYNKNVEFFCKFLFKLGKNLVNRHKEIRERRANVFVDICEECFNLRKLLLINVTVNGKSKLHEINLPERKFIIFQADYDSHVLDILRNFLPMEKTEFAALIHFPTQEIGDCVLVDEFQDDSELERCEAVYLSHFKDDNNFDIIIDDNDVVDDQDAVYRKLEQEALMQQNEEEEEKKEENVEEKDNEHENLVKRINELPPEPESWSEGCITIKAKLPSGKTLMRNFGKN